MDRLRQESSGEGEEISVAPAGNGLRETIPLVVDLDGTLVSTDTLFESALSLIRQKPSSLLMFVVWLSRGKAVLKAEIAKRIQPDAKTLPYRADLLNYLRRERDGGRKIVLATASSLTTATAVAAYLELFDE